VGIAIQVVSSHPSLIRAVERVLARLKDLPVCILPSTSDAAEGMSHSGSPRLFLLDVGSMGTELGRLAERCRACAPGSKFLALFPPEDKTYEDKARFFYWGIDGFVELRRTWRKELPLAIDSILRGQPWVPREVLLTLVQEARTLLDPHLPPGHSLTARQRQVLHLFMRGLANKEISSALGISERTVMSHVSNVLRKLQLEDRRGLSPNKLTFWPVQLSATEARCVLGQGGSRTLRTTAE
jgi:NarL family two-component system response regulator LiaR